MVALLELIHIVQPAFWGEITIFLHYNTWGKESQGLAFSKRNTAPATRLLPGFELQRHPFHQQGNWLRRLTMTWRTRRWSWATAFLTPAAQLWQNSSACDLEISYHHLGEYVWSVAVWYDKVRKTPCADCLSPLSSNCYQEYHTACPDHGEILESTLVESFFSDQPPVKSEQHQSIWLLRPIFKCLHILDAHNFCKITKHL